MTGKRRREAHNSSLATRRQMQWTSTTEAFQSRGEASQSKPRRFRLV